MIISRSLDQTATILYNQKWVQNFFPPMLSLFVYLQATSPFHPMNAHLKISVGKMAGEKDFHSMEKIKRNRGCEDVKGKRRLCRAAILRRSNLEAADAMRGWALAVECDYVNSRRRATAAVGLERLNFLESFLSIAAPYRSCQWQKLPVIFRPSCWHNRLRVVYMYRGASRVG